MRTVATALAGLIAMAAPAVAQDAVARMMGPDGAEIGEVTLTRTADGVLVSADLTGLAPGEHGFHIHQTGACEPDFEAAGEHFNPGDKEHGYLNEAGHHAGDMPNISVGEDGSARADVHTTDVSLEDGAANGLLDEDGSAIIVHENPDSYGQEAGAGGRVACGVVEAM